MCELQVSLRPDISSCAATNQPNKTSAPALTLLQLCPGPRKLSGRVSQGCEEIRQNPRKPLSKAVFWMHYEIQIQISKLSLEGWSINFVCCKSDLQACLINAIDCTMTATAGCPRQKTLVKACSTGGCAAFGLSYIILVLCIQC